MPSRISECRMRDRVAVSHSPPSALALLSCRWHRRVKERFPEQLGQLKRDVSTATGTVLATCICMTHAPPLLLFKRPNAVLERDNVCERSVGLCHCMRSIVRYFVRSFVRSFVRLVVAQCSPVAQVTPRSRVRSNASNTAARVLALHPAWPFVAIAAIADESFTRGPPRRLRERLRQRPGPRE